MLTPLSDRLAARYAQRPQLEPADAVIVLGGGFAHGALGDPSLQRLVHGVRLQRRGLAPLLVLTGEARPRGPSEPAVRAELARSFGVPPDAILALPGANTTRDEAALARAALLPRGVQSVLLVSSALHLTRAREIFEREGFRVLPAPVESSFAYGSGAAQRLAVARLFVREMAGHAYNRLAGYL